MWLTVISTGRPAAEQKMTSKVGGATWYVRDSDTYPLAMERRNAPDGISIARNAALDDAAEHDLPCVQLSDDLGTVRRLGANGKAEPYSLRRAIPDARAAMVETGAKLAGAAPTANPFFARDRVSTAAFIVGDFIIASPDSPVRFDPELPLKEDYDFTLAHLCEHGTVARCDWMLLTFAHRTNHGGAVTERTDEREQYAIARLRERWGAAIRDNPRRPNEILMNAKALDCAR